MNYLRQIFIFSFSVYLVLLMALPCSDAHRSSSTITAQLSEITHQSDSHRQHSEVCTPFCICSSCVVAIVLHPCLEFDFFNPDHRDSNICNFYQSVQSDFHGSIWQPPQLV